MDKLQRLRLDLMKIELLPGGLAGGYLGTCMILLGPGGGYSNVLEDGSSPLEDPGVYRQERGSNTQS